MARSQAIKVRHTHTHTQREREREREILSVVKSTSTLLPLLRSAGVGGSGRWKATMNDDRSTDINFNLSQYMIDQHHQHHHQQHDRDNRLQQPWRAAVSADAWRREDLAEDSRARERNTWELTHRSASSNFALRRLTPARLVTADLTRPTAWNYDDELTPSTAADLSDEEVWIPQRRRRSSHISQQPRLTAAATTGRHLYEVNSPDDLRTTTSPRSRPCTTRS